MRLTRHLVRRFCPGPLLLWREGRGRGELCMAYGGKMGDGETRVCGKFRGHLDSHAYDRINDVLGLRGWSERDDVLVQARPDGQC